MVFGVVIQAGKLSKAANTCTYCVNVVKSVNGPGPAAMRSCYSAKMQAKSVRGQGEIKKVI